MTDSNVHNLNFFVSTFSSDVIFRRRSSVHNRILLSESSFEKLLDFRNLNFQESSLIIDNAYYNKILVKWNQISENISVSDNIEEITNVLIPLELNFRNLGQYDDEDACYYFRKEKERTYIPSFWNHFSWATCGYFVKPFRILKIHAPLIIVLFCFVHFPLVKKELQSKYLTTNKFKIVIDSFYSSAKTFFTMSFHTPPTTPLFLRLLVLAESISGWFLLTLFIISLSRVYIR